MSRLAYTISNQSLTVFVQGRPRSITKDAATYEEVRKLLVTPGDHNADHILDLVDVRRAVQRASHNAIQFDGGEVIWKGMPIHNVWVERILDHIKQDEDYSALWAALDKLVHNPTQAAVERLPIFLDRVGLPFMPDGRFLAFKGVQADYLSAHASPDGSRFRHLVGDKPRMAREDVDADWNQTCSTGLHVGAPGYVRNHYSGGTYALVLVAVDPVDVVSVPRDYDGEKMRVCGYEVIEHLDQAYTDEIFGRLRSTYITPPPVAPAPAPAARNLAHLAQVGDVVTLSGIGDSIVHGVLAVDGTLLVTPGIPVDAERVVAVKRGGAFVGDIRQELYREWLGGQAGVVVDEALAAAGVETAPPVPAEVDALPDNDDVLPGDLVQVIEGGWPPEGIYPVVEVLGSSIKVQTEHDGIVVVDDGNWHLDTARPWMRAEIGGTVELKLSAGLVSEFPGPGWYEVIDLQLHTTNIQLQVRTTAGPWWVAADRVITTRNKA